ncbi:hypothetical protein BCR33DRAFT_723060 [Rhizoclosmatium globosum]|uniref:Uncharacterized protein n=1 Tax=Rhizoclosmatium globosum TaxID=329046 RepID=A0A1Y2BGB0_9FUNG|nr:hypothetical protein BCR33DRAFT_723060 [Rhizoclosmatium globosum]|eukprot:ORY33849.1 hypothetical protein BCR33DRAFT_723060 [Rhizoclosmatium globosum]
MHGDAIPTVEVPTRLCQSKDIAIGMTTRTCVVPPQSIEIPNKEAKNHNRGVKVEGSSPCMHTATNLMLLGCLESHLKPLPSHTIINQRTTKRVYIVHGLDF